MSKKLLLLMLLTLLIGTLNLASKVEKAEASGTIYIRADGSIDPPDAPVSTADNVTYTLTANVTSDANGIVVERNNVVVDGNGYTLQGSGTGNGTDLSGRENVTVRNTQITAFDYGIMLYSSNNNSITENSIENNGEGIYLRLSSDNSISGNTITDSSYPIRLEWSSNNIISENNATNNHNEVALYWSSNNIISENNMTANTNGAIFLSWSIYNMISGNNIANNRNEGIHLDDSPNNSISGNNITNNHFEGIGIYASSSNNTISNNNIGENGYYPSLLGGKGRGIWLSDSSNNPIYHNNFINNSNQVLGYGSTNRWDDGYPSGGNFWSNYNGTDANHDGIGDSNYTIDANNNDRYPLMGMFYDFNVSWIEPGYNVGLISNSSVSAFDVGFWIEHPENPNTRIIEFNVTGETGTAGFCRICIPTALLNATYTVLLNRTEIPCTLLSCSNSTHSYLYFNYTHSTEEVTITPEFPSFLILPLFMIATLLTVLVYSRKQKREKRSSTCAF
jgi:parallel beta-helix repeat protein